MKRTARGFGIYAEFKDGNGSAIRVQESSSAEKRHVWIFAEWGPYYGNSPAREHTCCSPHLTVAQAKRLIAGLQKFIAEAGRG